MQNIIIKQKINIFTNKLSKLIKFLLPANIAEEKIMQIDIFKIKDNLDCFNLNEAFCPLKSTKVNNPQKRKKATKIPKKENTPKREKNTAISLPLINPEPTTQPTIASIVDRISFIR